LYHQDKGGKEMLKMSQINSIRDLSNCGYHIGEISKKLGIDRKTVRKHLNEENFSPTMPTHCEKPSILDPYKTKIQDWLAADQRSWYKQQHTAKRIFDRLCKEEMFSGSYSTVQRYVKIIRSRQLAVASQELVWEPGTAQVDFGEADFTIRGQLRRMKYLAVSFPYSNDGFVQVFGGETAECVCQGLRNIFEYIGGTPHLLVFDNATGVGRRVGAHIHETDLFHRFRAHYGCRVRFCNPYAGYEKGNVERKVGYIRANLFVPVPSFQDLTAYNRMLLDLHREKASEIHYKKGKKIADLFLEDRKSLRELPRQPFRVCRYEWLKADGYGKICLDGKHFYSTKPENSWQQVLVGIYADHIDILKEDGSKITSHERIFGSNRTDSSDYSTTLSTLMKNPGAWGNSGLRKETPHILRDYMDQLDRKECRKHLHTLHDLSEYYGLETAMAAMERSIHGGRLNTSDATVLAERIASFGLNTQPVPGPSLSVYDDAFLKGENLH
jgi:transposase